MKKAIRGTHEPSSAVIISARGEVLEEHLDTEEQGAIRGNQGQAYLRSISTKKSIVNVSVASSMNFAYLRGQRGRRGEHLHAAGGRRWAHGSAEFGTAHTRPIGLRNQMQSEAITDTISSAYSSDWPAYGMHMTTKLPPSSPSVITVNALESTSGWSHVAPPGCSSDCISSGSSSTSPVSLW